MSTRGRPTSRKRETNLLYFRKLHGFTQQFLADYLGVDQSMISKAEYSADALSGKNWDRLADLFNVDPRILKGRKKISAKV